MKKVLSLVLTAVMSLSVMAACSNKTTTAGGDKTTAAVTTAKAGDNKTEATGKIAKVGIGQNGSIMSSKDFTADKGGVAQSDVIIAAVALDKDGKIVEVKFDSAQTKVEFNPDGTIKTDVNTPAKTKKELGDAYGMKKNSKIGKEWHEQIAALEKWMVGKTPEQVASMKTKKGADDNHPAVPDEADLTSSVSITVQDYLAAVSEAAKNAVEVKGGADKMGLGVITFLEKSKAKTADKGAVAGMDTYMSVTAFKDGKVAYNYIDAMQASVAYDAAGKVTSKKDEALKTKQELKDAYNMKAQSGIKKEWYEQANALSTWMVGKSADQIKGMKLADKSGKKITDEADLKSSVTIGVEPELKVFEKTVESAK